METQTPTTTEPTGAITPGKTAPGGGAGRDPIPVGKHLCEIIHVEKSLAKNGSARLSWRHKIVAGDLKGRIIFDDTYLSAAALWKVKSLAAAAGLKAEETFDPDKPAELIEKFQGKQLWVVLAEDIYTNSDGVEVSGRKVTAYDSTEAQVPRERTQSGGSVANDGGDKSEGDGGAKGDIPF